MTTWGPFTGAAGVVQQCKIAPDARAIYVINTSRFDLQIGTSWGQPSSNANFSGLPSTFTIPQGDRRGIRLAGADYGANGFPGWVWVLPLDKSTTQAFTGTVATGLTFTIETYGDPDQLPPDYASPQYVNAASQERMIALPPVPFFQPFFGVFPYTDTVLAQFDLHTFFNTNLSNSQGFNLYIYSLVLTPEPATASGYSSAVLGSSILQSDGVTVVHVNPIMARFALTWGTKTGSNVSQPVYVVPNGFPLSMPFLANLPNSYYLNVIMSSLVGSNTAGGQTDFTLVADVDVNTYNVPGGIGWPNIPNHATSPSPNTGSVF